MRRGAGASQASSLGPSRSYPNGSDWARLHGCIQDKKLVWSLAAHVTAVATCHWRDIFDDLLARALRCLSHRPLLSGYDEPETLSYQLTLFGPIGADVRHAVSFSDVSDIERLYIKVVWQRRFIAMTWLQE